MDKLNKKHKILTDWLAQFEQTKEFSIDVSKVLELTNQQIIIVENIPGDNEEFKIELENKFTSDNEYLESTLPQIETSLNVRGFID